MSPTVIYSTLERLSGTKSAYGWITVGVSSPNTMLSRILLLRFYYQPIMLQDTTFFLLFCLFYTHLNKQTNKQNYSSWHTLFPFPFCSCSSSYIMLHLSWALCLYKVPSGGGGGRDALSWSVFNETSTALESTGSACLKWPSVTQNSPRSPDFFVSH